MIIWLYGKPYSGKTTFASQFPNAYFISLDKNAQFLTDNYVNVSNIDDYSKAIKDFMKDPKEYETLVIDTIDLLFDVTPIDSAATTEPYQIKIRVYHNGYFGVFASSVIR